MWSGLLRNKNSLSKTERNKGKDKEANRIRIIATFYYLTKENERCCHIGYERKSKYKTVKKKQQVQIKTKEFTWTKEMTQ